MASGDSAAGVSSADDLVRCEGYLMKQGGLIFKKVNRHIYLPTAPAARTLGKTWTETALHD